MLYAYISKDEADYTAVAEQHHDVQGVTIGSVRDPYGRQIIVLQHPVACDRLKLEIEAGQPAGKPLRDLLAELYRQLGRGVHAPMTILIHFGGQRRDECIVFTRVMNEVARSETNLIGFRFIAISQYNACPENFFRNKRFMLPDDAVVNQVLAQWGEGKDEIPAYDHLRGIVLLCQALKGLSEKEKKDKFSSDVGINWWQSCLWGGNFPLDEKMAFSEAERRVMGQSGLVREFCLALLTVPSKLNQYSDRLPEIVAEITELLLSKG